MMPQPRSTTHPSPQDLRERLALRTDRRHVRRGDFSRNTIRRRAEYSIMDCFLRG
jgi:hypothetical protein